MEWLVLLAVIAAAAALPTNDDQVIYKLDEGSERYQYMRSGDGTLHLVDTWVKISDLRESARFNPDSENIYHIYTRANPTLSQPLLSGNNAALQASNFNANRRTVIVLHGWIDNAQGNANSVLVPAFLEAEDVNVISVDWSSGGSTINYAAAVTNTFTSGQSVARFVNWVCQVTGTNPTRFHIIGHSLGGHQSGIIGRFVNGNIAYITALDPALPGFITNDNKFREDDGTYTEVIHTNAGNLGYLSPLGQVDFYPNGGIGMPGCSSVSCDHDRCFHYMAESLRTGGFTARQCATYVGAMSDNCVLWGRLQMGGISPKTGASGMFAAAGVDCFHTTMRKRAASLVRRVRASPNIILSMIGGRVDCPYMRHCCGLHAPYN